eukprot:6291416-Prymnesium_polylepis.1
MVRREGWRPAKGGDRKGLGGQQRVGGQWGPARGGEARLAAERQRGRAMRLGRAVACGSAAARRSGARSNMVVGAARAPRACGIRVTCHLVRAERRHRAATVDGAQRRRWLQVGANRPEANGEGRRAKRARRGVDHVTAADGSIGCSALVDAARRVAFLRDDGRAAGAAGGGRRRRWPVELITRRDEGDQCAAPAAKGAEDAQVVRVVQPPLPRTHTTSEQRILRWGLGKRRSIGQPSRVRWDPAGVTTSRGFGSRAAYFEAVGTDGVRPAGEGRLYPQLNPDEVRVVCARAKKRTGAPRAAHGVCGVPCCDV